LFETNRQNDWMKKLWGISRRPGAPSTTPGKVLEDIRPVFDGLGWINLEELQLQAVTATAQALLFALPAVAEGTSRLYLRGIMEHNDPGGTKNLWIEYDLLNTRAPIGGVASNSPLNAFVPGTIQGLPMLVTSGNHLTMISGNSFAVTTRMVAELFFVDLPPGSYIPGVSV